MRWISSTNGVPVLAMMSEVDGRGGGAEGRRESRDAIAKKKKDVSCASDERKMEKSRKIRRLPPAYQAANPQACTRY